MTLLTDSKYGYRGYGSRMEVSLLRCSRHPDPYPEIGHRFFRIGIAATGSGQAELKELGSRFAHRDLAYASNRAHQGQLPLDGTFVKADNAIVTAVKVAEDKNGLILRLASLREDQADVTVEVPGMTAAWLTDLSEQDLEQLPITDGKIHLDMDANTVKTLRIF